MPNMPMETAILPMHAIAQGSSLAMIIMALSSSRHSYMGKATLILDVKCLDLVYGANSLNDQG